MCIDSMANEVAKMNEAWEKGVGIEVDNIGEENIDAGKMEDRKEKRNEVSRERNKIDNGVKGKKVMAKRKMVEKTGKGKMKILDVGTEDIC
ncbi:hypothetical protein Tco_0769574 [Tanacetum coccineum]|uniref:Uncharacterized protein n=1 Tax=Tanacetum coccineum TaxID=301880 RepID=A0ABQ4Z9T3_9ASTR